MLQLTDKNKTTTREFTLIAEENHTVPISNEVMNFMHGLLMELFQDLQ